MVRELVDRVIPASISPLIEPTPLPLVAPLDEPHRLYDSSKRITDILVATFLLVLTLPLVMLACLAILFTARQRPILLQRRVGWLGYEFTMLKLRTMDCDEAPPAFLRSKEPFDQRVTAVGWILRRTSIDELPQLLNVLSGQMTLVGPRPALASEVAAFREPWLRRLGVRPGLTGLWQVSGRSCLPPERWMALDRYYLGRRSWRFDLQILARTVLAVLSMRGAW